MWKWRSHLIIIVSFRTLRFSMKDERIHIQVLVPQWYHKLPTMQCAILQIDISLQIDNQREHAIEVCFSLIKREKHSSFYEISSFFSGQSLLTTNFLTCTTTFAAGKYELQYKYCQGNQVHEHKVNVTHPSMEHTVWTKQQIEKKRGGRNQGHNLWTQNQTYKKVWQTVHFKFLRHGLKF